MATSCSWDQFIKETKNDISSALSTLREIWEEIGYSNEVQCAYRTQAKQHLENLLNDMIGEAQERKRTLLEQIKRLMNIVSNLSKELGKDLVTSEYENLPLPEIERTLREYVYELQQLKEERVSHVKELLARECNICKYLGVQPVGIDTELPTNEELDTFKLYLDKQEAEMNRLESVFQDTRHSIIKMMDDLGIVPSLNFDHIVCNKPESFVYSPNNMEQLRTLHEQLKSQVDMAKQQVNEMKEELMALWKYLDEPPQVCDRFLESYTGYSTTIINALRAEIKRCREKRRENISRYVSQIRAELVKLWDVCRYGDAQRNQFAAFQSQTYTEDLLTLHELEVERLRRYYDSNREIFELLQERENLWTKMKELVQRANDPDRLHNRGGQLLMEEKERKIINRKLPKIEERLKGLIDEYEAAHGEIFTINGVSFDDLLKGSLAAFNTEKESLKKTKKEAKDKSMKNALSASKYTPSGTSMRRNTPQSTTAKRRLPFAPSPNTSAKRRNTSAEKSRLTVVASKVRRSGQGVKRTLQRSMQEKKKRKSKSENNAIDTTYGQFENHLKTREELRSSLIPEQVLKNANKTLLKTPTRTPIRRLKKNSSAVSTPNVTPKIPVRGKSPCSPRTVKNPKLTSAPNMPIIF